MMAIRLGRDRLTAASNGFDGPISGTCGSGTAIPNGLLNGRVFGNDMDHLSGQPSGLAKNRDAAGVGLRLGTSARQRRNFHSMACRDLAGTPVTFIYLASAASCTAALFADARTAARNESAPFGGCTLPDSVLAKETFLP